MRVKLRYMNAIDLSLVAVLLLTSCKDDKSAPIATAQPSSASNAAIVV